MSVIIASMLSLALVGGAPTPTPKVSVQPKPQPACITPERTGTFRVTATKPDGMIGVPAILVLENIEGCLEVTYVTDEKAPAVIDHLSQSNDMLRGQLNVTGSAAQVTLRFNGSSVAGSITQGKQEWRIEGRKTS